MMSRNILAAIVQVYYVELTSRDDDRGTFTPTGKYLIDGRVCPFDICKE